jgi:AcrR family transcriptional regulator
VSRRAEILDAAVEVLESEGPDALTMRRLAAALGIRAPSLYKHVHGKDDIESGLQELALVQLGAALGRAGPDLIDLAFAYRRWALSHPRLYEIATRRPLRRGDIAPGVEASAAAPVLAATGGDEHRARAVWAVVHGLVDLELAGRFPPEADLDRTWQSAVSAFVA